MQAGRDPERPPLTGLRLDGWQQAFSSPLGRAESPHQACATFPATGLTNAGLIGVGGWPPRALAAPPSPGLGPAGAPPPPDHTPPRRKRARPARSKPLAGGCQARGPAPAATKVMLPLASRRNRQRAARGGRDGSQEPFAVFVPGPPRRPVPSGLAGRPAETKKKKQKKQSPVPVLPALAWSGAPWPPAPADSVRGPM